MTLPQNWRLWGTQTLVDSRSRFPYAILWLCWALVQTYILFQAKP